MPTLSQVINAPLQLDHPGKPAPTTATRTHLRFAGAPCSSPARPSGAKSLSYCPCSARWWPLTGGTQQPLVCQPRPRVEDAIHAAAEAGRGSESRPGINSALSSDNLPSTCSLHSRRFVTRILPARVISLTRRWRTRQSGSELNLGYPQGTGSCFVRPGWSNKGSWKSALKNLALVILHLV